jgi:hypothetical protein
MLTPKHLIQERLSRVAHNALMLNLNNLLVPSLSGTKSYESSAAINIQFLFILKNTKIKITSSWLTAS